MKTAIFSFLENEFKIMDMSKPDLGKDDVLVKVKVSGLCGTDLNEINGNLKDKLYDKEEIVLGHEFSGVVDEVGEEVKEFEKGDRVFSMPHYGCGKCKRCLEGEGNLCDRPIVYGMTISGSNAEYVVANVKSLYKIPDFLDFKDAALIGDTYGVAYRAIQKAGELKDKKIVVVGLGPVGLALVHLLKERGMNNVIGRDIEKYREELCNKLFGIPNLDLEQVKEADVVFEVSGSKDAFDKSFKVLNRGGKIILVGLPNDNFEFDALRTVYKEFSIMGSMGYSEKELMELLEFVKENKIRPRKIITNEFELEKIQDAFDLFKSRKSGKVVLEIK